MHPRTGFGAWSCLNQGFLPCLRDRGRANPSVALRPILSPAEASLRAEEPAETLAGQAQEGSFGPTAPAYPAVLGFKKKKKPKSLLGAKPSPGRFGSRLLEAFPPLRRDQQGTSKPRKAIKKKSIWLSPFF